MSTADHARASQKPKSCPATRPDALLAPCPPRPRPSHSRTPRRPGSPAAPASGRLSRTAGHRRRAVRSACAASRRLGRTRCPRPPAAPTHTPKGSHALSSCALRRPTLTAVSAQLFPTLPMSSRCCASLRTARAAPRRPAVWTFPAVLPSVALLCAPRAGFNRGKRRPRARHGHRHVADALWQNPFRRSTIV